MEIYMPYAIYGKRTQEWYDKDKHILNPPDKTFKALDATGHRVQRLTDAFAFATKQDAQDYLDEHATEPRPGTLFEIRPIK